MSVNGAIITGAASGIGLALTKDLISKGWRVVMADINPSGEAIADRLGANTLFVRTDTSDWSSQVELFHKGTTFDWCPDISVLAAKAGITDSTFLPTVIAPDAVSPPHKPNLQTINVNLLGTIYNVQLFLHHFTRQPAPSQKGRITITTSEGGIYALPLDPIYCASKHALVGLTRSLAPALLAHHNTIINAILPDFVETAITAPIAPITPRRTQSRSRPSPRL